MAAQAIPNLRAERELFDEGAPFVLACDEVGRGALAGPVSVGLVVIDASVRRMPAGLRDSKLMTEPKRDAMAPRAAAWVRAWAVGEASAAEIDELGIMACLGLAGARAFAALAPGTGLVDEVAGSPLILDGNHDWLSPAIARRVAVRTRIKADRDCASVAAASVIAKVHRDGGMRRAHADTPLYSWDENKGYSSRAHFAAIEQHGPNALHRRTWLHEREPEAPALFDLGVG